MNTKSIDLNSDLGEGMATDPDVMAWISSANIACGGHAGDRESMGRTIRLALERGRTVGAHPGYPDREGFGRRSLDMEDDALRRSIIEQLGSLGSVAKMEGTVVRYVKPHGALYNRCERDPRVAAVVASAIAEHDGGLVVLCPPDLPLATSSHAHGLTTAREGFCDRRYEPDGTLSPRSKPGALITDPAAAAEHALALARKGAFDSLCIHGDTPGAPEIARQVREALEGDGFTIRSFV